MIGEFTGIATSFCWAACTYYYSFSIDAMSPDKLNLLKSIQAFIVLSIFLVFIQDNFFGESLSCYLLLVISGILGIGMGDSFWFKSVSMIGPRITILFELLNPLLSFIMASLFLN